MRRRHDTQVGVAFSPQRRSSLNLMKILKYLAAFVFVCFLLPAGASVALYLSGDHPDSWRSADWSATGLLPAPAPGDEAAIYIMSARTGGLKGALASHSWILLKPANGGSYVRYDKVGWGSPIRRNGYPPDGRWYSNVPRVVGQVRGAEAERLIPKVEAAVANYPYASRGGYRIWPGPNSNTFVATVLRAVPDLGIRLPPEAVGRDYLPMSMPVAVDPDWRDIDLSLGGFAGVGLGLDTGLEIRIGGLVFGLDFLRPAIKLPGFGRVGTRVTAQE
jgi:hypothetical protein